MNTIPKAILESIDTFLNLHADSLPNNVMETDKISTFIGHFGELVESFSVNKFEEVDYQAWLQSTELERLIDLIGTDAFKDALDIASTAKHEGYSTEQKFFEFILDNYKALKLTNDSELIKDEIKPKLESLNTEPDPKHDSDTPAKDITTANNPEQSEVDQKQKLKPLLEEGLRKAASTTSDNIAADMVEPIPESSNSEPEIAANQDMKSDEVLPEAIPEKPSETVQGENVTQSKPETGEVKISAWKRAQQQAQAAKQKAQVQQVPASSNTPSEDNSIDENPDHSLTEQNSNSNTNTNKNEPLTETKSESDQDISDEEQENLPSWKKAQMEAAKNIDQGKNQKLEPLLDKALRTATSIAPSEIAADELVQGQFNKTTPSTIVGESSKNMNETNDSQKVKTITPTELKKQSLNDTDVVSQKVNSVVSDMDNKQTEKDSDSQKSTTPFSENIAQGAKKPTPGTQEQETLFQRIEKEQALQREQQRIAKEQAVQAEHDRIAKEQSVHEEQLRVAKAHAQIKEKQPREHDENGNIPGEVIKEATSRGSVVGAQVGSVVAGVIGGTASGIYHGISSIFKGRKEETLRTMSSDELISEEEKKIVKLKDIITNGNFKYTDNYQNFQLYAQDGYSGFKKTIDFGDSSDSLKSIEFDFDKPNYLSRIGKQLQSKIKSGADAVNLSEAISDEIENLHDFCDEYDDVKKSKKPSISVLNGIFKATEITQRRANMLDELHSTLFSHIKDSAIDLTDEQLDTLSSNQKFVEEESKTLMERAKDLLSSIKDKLMSIFEKGVGRNIEQDEMSKAHDNIKKVGSSR